uniref:Uncharacterized protein n=1 Tax=Cannabis sativa TaxID=3483 RepID=A0A803QHC7_CANSA
MMLVVKDSHEVNDDEEYDNEEEVEIEEVSRRDDNDDKGVGNDDEDESENVTASSPMSADVAHRQVPTTLPKPPEAGHLGVHIGGPHITGETNKDKECYAQTFHHEPKRSILAGKERDTKKPKHGEPTVSFSKGDPTQSSDVWPLWLGHRTHRVYQTTPHYWKKSDHQNSNGTVRRNQRSLDLQCHDGLTGLIQLEGGNIHLLPLPEIPNKAWGRMLREDKQSVCHYYNLALSKAKKKKMHPPNQEHTSFMTELGM